MFQDLTVLGVALGYLGLLFAVASYGDRLARRRPVNQPRPFIYALSLGVYCTSWTFFGSVGFAAQKGFDFLPIYIGPFLLFALGWPIVRTIVRVAKRHNITSIADFISARYGKNQALGVLVATIAVIGLLPLIAVQLEAVSKSLDTMLSVAGSADPIADRSVRADDLALTVALAMAGFSVLFGTRYIDATEHQHGLMLAIATESVVKLAAFLLVGAYVTFGMIGGIGPMIEQIASRPDIAVLFTQGFDGGRWFTMTLLSSLAVLMLPRMFHVAVVENSNPRDIQRAAWLFPLYLVAINLFVVPIAVAGLIVFPDDSVDADTFALALPAAADHKMIALAAFIGGLSAATATVIVTAVALSIMVCNSIVVPLILARRAAAGDVHENTGRLLLVIRRVAIFAILMLAYLFDRFAGVAPSLTETGLLTFTAVAQFAPAFIGGLIWRRATARGAIAGIAAGFLMWLYTLLLPALAHSGLLPAELLRDGPFGIAMLRPQMLLNFVFDPLTHGVVWSLLANVTAFVTASMMRPQQPIERLQAKAFAAADLPMATPSFRLWRTSVGVRELMATVSRYLGKERTERSFLEFAQARSFTLDFHGEADIRLLRFAEHLLASAVGAASSRLVMGILIEKHSGSAGGALKLLDDASAAIQQNRDLLQSAIEHVRQGIAVFDPNLQLICWNRQFLHVLQLPTDLGRIGVPLNEVVRAVLGQTDTAAAEFDRAAEERLRKLVVTPESYQERLKRDGSVIQVRSSFMPDRGMVITFSDITEQVAAAEALQWVNETLERRVQERTKELTGLNEELGLAKAAAEAANLGKTKFIAAASHDILQPLSAARLYATSLVERQKDSRDGQLARNIDASLEGVEEILTALLDISRLDAGALKPEISDFRLDQLLHVLQREFGPQARKKGLDLRVLASRLTVRSDRRLVRRVLQNLVSNAIKYTERGRVLVGCRRAGGNVRIEVHDTGPGIPESQRGAIFEEFRRLHFGPKAVPGLGLGLSIVERIVAMLEVPLDLKSSPGKGSRFAFALPVAADLPVDGRQAGSAGPATSRLRGLTVMAIDDDAGIVEGMRALLEGWGCRVFTAATAAEAVRVFAESDAIDVIVADYHLDHEDGLAIIAALRRSARRHVPAVLITADRTRAVQERAAAQDVLYLRKPVRPATLRALMTRSLAHAEAAE